MDTGPYGRAMHRLARSRGVDWVGRFATVDGEQIHYHTAGAGPAVVFIHGLVAWSFTWRHNLAAVAASGYRVFALDLRGFGLSQKTSGRGLGLTDQARLVARFMDVLGIEQATLIGHSMGGEISLRLTLTAPTRVRGLVLVASAAYVRASLPGWAKFSAAVPYLAPIAVRWFYTNRRMAKAVLKAAYGQPEKISPETIAGYLLPLYTPGAVSGFTRLLTELDFGATAAQIGDIRHPACLIWGERDRWIPISHGERLKKALGAAAMHRFPAAGHLVPEEFPAEFNAIVIEWLQLLHGKAITS